MPLQPADELTETLLAEILQHGKFGVQKRVAVMVNNLGATTEMELAIVARHAVSFLERKGFTVERIYAGTFLSSLDMAGISISVLGLNDERLRWLDAATTAPAWPNVLKQPPGQAGSADRNRGEPSAQFAAGSGAQTEAGRKVRSGHRGRLQGLDRRRRRADGDGPGYRRRRSWRQHGACGQSSARCAGIVSFR